jgi:diguanylate cyclase (GGDEF)-like protein
VPPEVEKVEEMLRTIPGESWALVGADGRITYATDEEREGRHIAFRAHPDDLPAVLDLMERVVANPHVPFRVLTRVDVGDEQWRVVEVTAVNRLDDAMGAIVVRTREVDQEGPASRDDTSLIESLAEAVPTPILVVDQGSNVLFANAEARALVGDDIESVIAMLAGAHGDTTTLQVGERWVQARIAARSGGFIAMLDDITSQHLLASRDALTGVANRAAFESHLRTLLARPAHEPVSVVFVDLDRFKEINDTKGHAAGDRVLRDVAVRLQAEVRPQDMVARFGGDEFAVVCDGLAADAAERLAKRLLASIEVGASAGTATSPPVASDPESLVAAADRAMYERKRG